MVAVTAVRTGCGKSQTSHYIIRALKEAGLSTVLVRHPMPYGAHPRLPVRVCRTLPTIFTFHVPSPFEACYHPCRTIPVAEPSAVLTAAIPVPSRP